MQQSSILSYFAKTPKSSPSPAPSTSTTASPSSSDVKTTPATKLPPSTPTSSRPSTGKNGRLSGNKKSTDPRPGKKRPALGEAEVETSPTATNGNGKAPTTNKRIRRDEVSPDYKSVKKEIESPKVTPDVKTQKKENAPPPKDNSVDKSKKKDKPKGGKESDEEDEYRPDTSIETESESEVSEVASSSGIESEDSDEEVPAKRQKKSVKKEVQATPKSVASSASTRTPARQLNGKAKVLDLQSPQVSTKNSSEEGRWPHLKLQWLKPENIMDKNKRRRDHPDYDPTTLNVPTDYLNGLTPAVRQWWEMKSENFDSVLFFKLGKFYEMYHMDAVCGVEELGLIFMKGDLAHCGFPEGGYARYAEILVQKGYKLARVEQTETPDMMAERCKKQYKPSKFDKVVKREICQFTTQGVRIASVQDISSHPFQPSAEYLYAILEKSQPNEPSEFGVCFIDTTIGTFHIGQFKDDRHCSRLRTLLSHHTPVEILNQRKTKGVCLSATVMQLLNNLSGIRKNELVAETEFWGAQKTLTFLAEGTYFRGKETESVEWPESLKLFQSQNDNLGLTPEAGWELGIKCLGAIIFYLSRCLVEHDLISLGQFAPYVPVDAIFPDESTKPGLEKRRSKFMVLDAVTLRNLEVTQGPKNILSLLDRCATQFGKRLLRQWTCAPLATPGGISERQDAIEELMTMHELRDQIVPMLKSLMDLERMLNKIHSLGSRHHSTDHPDARAIMFEEKKYSKRKILDLTTVLKNFKTCVGLINLVRDSRYELKSTLLRNVISEFPALESILKFFDKAFDHATALEDGKIIPVAGVDEEYDTSSQAILDLQKEIDSYLKEMKARFNKQVKYFGTDKKRYQLEISNDTRVPNEFEMSSNRKGFKRYYTVKTKEFLAKMIQLESSSEIVLRDITRRIFAQFDEHRETWRKAVSCVAILDVLISLTVFSESQENMCRPTVSLMTGKAPFINIENGRHPALSQDTYIPNDSKLGSLEDSTSGAFLLLTGPNMGGKSTLMRQIGVITVLAHLGCYVPATKCELSVVDRIFTRLGANDNIGEGESTFFVELSETSAVLQHSTQDSLVLMDELGRGTATYDGTAIAYAVANALAKIQCRSLFSTHYHTLVESLHNMPSIQLGHMACMIENENEEDPTDETITFLYKLVPGACPKSYGFNAAKLAGIPDNVIRVASRKAKELERNVKRVSLFRHICSTIDKKGFTLKDLQSMKVA